MQILDAHTHIFPPDVIVGRAEYAQLDRWFGLLYADPRAKMASAEALLASMDAAGVDRAVTFGFAFRDQGLCAACNAYVLEAAARHPDRLIPLAVANPAAGEAAVRDLVDALDRGARGIGELMPDGQGYALDDDAHLAPVMDLARSAERPVMVHVNEPLGHHYPGKGSQGPVEAYRLATCYPETTFILSHWGGGLPFYLLMPEVRLGLANVYYDTAASLYLYEDAVFPLAARLAPGRVLFGTDYPLIAQERFLARVREAGLTEAALRGILGANAEALFGEATPDGEEGSPHA